MELQERRIFLDDKRARNELEAFLEEENIRLDEHVEYTVGIFHKGDLVATGSLSKNALRSIAIKSEYQGTSLLNKLVSHLIREAYERGITHLFIYTKPEAVKSFRFLGFYEIARVDEVVLMENIPNGIDSYLNNLSKKRVNGEKIASIVMNANPFTKGHQYLVEYASKENDFVHLFVVSEEASIIPFDVRYELIKRGTKHLPNVILHDGGKYMVSSVTFPSYFMEDKSKVTSIYAALDLTIFKKYIIPTLNINSRYVGEEPYCDVTNIYNTTMKRVLKENDIEVKVIPRLKTGEKAISASFVRQLIKNEKWESVREFVPITTYEFFKSEEAKILIEKVKNHTGRH